MLSFVNAYSGYNQIQMNRIDAPKPIFKSNHDNFYYNVMPFSLKNVGGTYQRLMNAMLSHQIRWNMEVYVDDMIVKTTNGCNHADNL